MDGDDAALLGLVAGAAAERGQSPVEDESEYVAAEIEQRRARVAADHAGMMR